MRKMVLFCLLLAAVSAHAQDETVKKLKGDAAKEIKKVKDPADTIPQAWNQGGVYNLTLAQGSLSNWAAGGDEFSLSLNSLLSLFAFYQDSLISWDNTLDFNLGYLRTTSLGSRKNDDRIDLLSKVGRAVSSDWNVSALVNFRTQMLKGYEYDETERTLTSAFLAPAYLLTSVGMDYKPNPRFSVFLSPATARWVFVKDDSLAAKGLYGVEPGKHSRTELGAFASATYLTDMEKKMSYKGRLDLFSNYRRNPQNIDIFFSNLLAVKLSKVLAVTWNVDMIYDDDVRLFGDSGTSPAPQLKSLVGAGLSMKF
ncbi:MAG TPA: DUF3078 domain-containing protein [Chitinophagaceae bacterium]